MILRNHGLLAAGRTIAEAFVNIYFLERACQAQTKALGGGQKIIYPPEVFPQTVREGGPAEKRTCEDVFAAMVRLVDARDPSYRN